MNVWKSDDNQENQLGDAQGGFRRGSGGLTRFYSRKLLRKKYMEKIKDIYIIFMYLEKSQE